MPKSYEKLIEGNKEWSKSIKKSNPDLFKELSQGQHPEFLWIGCADSRVPSSDVTNQPPGSLFVHRNIANVVVPTDLNLLSVANYAVTALQIKHIVICGHSGCGGIKAAMSNASYGMLDGWLANIKSVYHMHKKELDSIEYEEDRIDRYVELNVMEQVKNMARVNFIQASWKNSAFPYIHGWVYQLHNGEVKDLKCTVNSVQGLEEMERLQFG